MSFQFADQPAPFFAKPPGNRTRGLKQNRYFPIKQWLLDNDDLLDGEWHEIPTSYTRDPSKGFRQRYRYLDDREGWFEFRYAPRPHKVTGVQLHRCEVRYIYGEALDAILDAKYGG